MIEDILSHIGELTPFWIYASLFAFAYVENVFPPSPSDLVVLIGGSLVGTGTLSFIPTLIVTTIGSILGFMTLFFIGWMLDKKVIKSGKLKFISLEAVLKVEAWFNKYGFWIIAVNRFLPGTRSVVSFFAGMSRLDIKRTIILSTISAFLWNFLIIYLGMLFGENVEKVDRYLDTYSNIVIIATIIIVLFFTIRYFFFKKKNESKNIQ
ncbi:MAG TPA: DedA family protein [Ignavibacteriaceae bacterium]|nr:DedA family protein [Ignavibacteriaceae bacterium]